MVGKPSSGRVWVAEPQPRDPPIKPLDRAGTASLEKGLQGGTAPRRGRWGVIPGRWCVSEKLLDARPIEVQERQ